MVEFRVNNIITQVHYPDEQTNNLLHGLLCYREPNYYFSPAYKSNQWDGYVRLYNLPTRSRPFGKFWTGLLYRARYILEGHGVDFRVVDIRKRPEPQKPLPLDPATLWNHGHGAVERIAQCTRGIVKFSTGGGKSRCAAHLLGRLNVPSVLIVHRDNLFRQILNEFTSVLQQPIGIIKGGTVKIEKFNVATIQSLYTKLYNATNQDLRKFVEEDARLVVVDECHHAKSVTYRYVLQQFLNAYYRVGLSGTPHKYETAAQTSDMHVEGAFGRIVAEASRESLEEKKILVPVRAHFL